MSAPSKASFALVNLGDGEMILILVLLFILAVVVACTGPAHHREARRLSENPARVHAQI